MTTVDDARSSPLKLVLSKAGITITANPANTSGAIGSNVTFGPIAYTSQLGFLTVVIRWQIQTGGAGGEWFPLDETAGFYEGVATPTLTVKNIDNFLANQTSLNFRCAVSYLGAAPVVTSTATLTITGPYCADYKRTFELLSSVGVAVESPPGVWTVQSVSGAEAFGLSGTLTYTWSKLSGDNFTLVTQFANFAVLQIVANAAGFYSSLWRCRISNGITSIDTDPIAVSGIALSRTPAARGISDICSPEVAYNGEEFSDIEFTDSVWIGPWAVGVLQNVRSLAAPTLTITKPDQFLTATTLSRNAPGGAAFVFYVWGQLQYFNEPGNGYGAAVGVATWGSPPA